MSVAQETSVSSRLGEFVATFRSDDLPDTMRHEAKRSLLNFFGVALGGWEDPAGGIACGGNGSDGV